MQRTRKRHRAPRRSVVPGFGVVGVVLLVMLVSVLWVVGGSPPGNADEAAAGASSGRAGSGSLTAARTGAQALAAPIGGIAGAQPSPRAGPGATGMAPAGAAGLAALGQPAARARLVADAITATNRERRAAGCPNLVADPVLTAVAWAHSVDMAASGYFRHDSPDGRSPFDRMTAAGFDFSVAAENIAAGQRSAAEVVRDWMDSPEHRANILTCSLTRVGVGLATGGVYGYYWTQDFATPGTGP
ncbi:CAP domain-containing protein [Frankia tisae]|uniref:CAP domain-containing protein n=1 Tax=Frankia tisae TaxID=2950104 RepID=UPI0021BF7D28|nr:CAP domain-containing protein [Frankia tisae]